MSAPQEPGAAPVLLSERLGPVLRLTLNRPHKLNALNAALQRALHDAFVAAASDPAMRVVILTGAGRAFCAGLDLHDFAASLGDPGARAGNQGSPMFQSLEAIPQPVIAAINGYAVTGGLELALGCDVLLASTRALFADTHAQVGVVPGAGLSQKLSRIIGLPRAMAFSLGGEYVGAGDALSWGLVSQVVPPRQLQSLALRLAQRLSEAQPEMLVTLKRLMREGAALPMGEALRLERDTHRQWAAEHPLTDPEQGRRVIERNRAARAKAAGPSASPKPGRARRAGSGLAAGGRRHAGGAARAREP